MAVVPISQRRVREAPLPGGELRPAAVGEGLAQAGQGIAQFGSAGMDFALAQEQANALLDQAAVRKRDNEDAAWFREQLWTGENAYFKKRGFDAGNARPVMEDLIRKRREEGLSALTSERQRALYGQAFDSRANQELEGIARHAIGQLREEKVRQTAARVEQAGQDAATWADNPERLAGALAVASAEMDTLADDEGWSPERLAGEKAKFVSQTFANIVRGKMVDDVEAAARFLDANRERIDPETERELDAQLKAPLLERRAESWADDVFGVASLDTSTAPDNPHLSPLPIPGRVTSGFGMRTNPVTGQRGMHKGVDVAMREGTPVTAPAAGRIVDAGMRGNAGNMVTIQHDDGTVTRYMHGSRILKTGGRVAAGEAFMLSGSTGRSTGPHLHYEVYASPEALAQGRPSDPKTGRTPDRYQPRRYNLDEMMKRADAYADAHGLGFDERKALEAEVVRRVGRSDQLLSRQEQDAADEATRTILSLGDGFTSTAQLGSTFSRLSPQEQLKFSNLAKANREPKARQTDYGFYARASDLYASDSRSFLGLSVAEARAKLSDGDFEQFMGWRRDVLKGDSNRTPKQVEHSRILSVTKDALAGDDNPILVGDNKKAMKPENIRRRDQFVRAMAEQVQAWQALHGRDKKPSDDDLRRMAGNLLMNTNSGTNVFEAGDDEIAASISERDRSRIIQALRARGLPETPANIARFYRQLGAFGRPQRVR